MRKFVLLFVFALLLVGSQDASAGLGDNEVCLPLDYYGRIETGSGFAVGDTVSNAGFTIQVTSVNDEGEITGFVVTVGTFDALVIHAGGGSETFTDPTGPFGHGLSFVAFCGESQDPTETPTDIPTETPTDVPTETPTRTVITDCKDPQTGQYVECPTETPTDVPTETPADVPTATPTDPTATATVEVEPPLVVVFPNTGSGDIHGESKTTVFVLAAVALVGLSVWYSLTTGRKR